MTQAAGSEAVITQHVAELVVSVEAPADPDAWQALLRVLSTADTYGSSDATGTPTVWAIVREETR